LFAHPLLFQLLDAEWHPQPPYPLSAGAAEKNKEQKNNDPPHVVAVKKIAKTSHDDTSNGSYGLSETGGCCSVRSFTILCTA
jgi:hypothetical protein